MNEQLNALTSEIMDSERDQSENYRDYLMEPIYEPICNNLFIARVMKDLPELIEFEALSKLKQRRGIKSVEYDDDGTVVSYELKN